MGGYNDEERKPYRVEFHKVDLKEGKVEQDCYPKLLIWDGWGQTVQAGRKLCVIEGRKLGEGGKNMDYASVLNLDHDHRYKNKKGYSSWMLLLMLKMLLMIIVIVVQYLMLLVMIITIVVKFSVNGYDISKGTVVMINAWAIGTDPVAWDEPEKFKPERFLESSIDFMGLDFELIPFGSGRRGCPGVAYSMVNIELVVANVKKFNWELPNGGEGKELDMSESYGLSVYRAIPLVAVATVAT